MNQSEPRTPLRFNLRFLILATAVVAVLLAVPVLGAMLFSGFVGIVLFFAVLVGVQYPIFKALRLGEGRSGSNDECRSSKDEGMTKPE